MNSTSILPDSPDFKLISLDESLILPDHGHAVHCCIYSRSPTALFKDYVSSALISMQMRFDGRLGFPGGLVDDGQTVLDALNRELQEEINLGSKLFATEDNYLFSHVELTRKLCLHFYAKEVSREDFETIEKDTFKAKDYGIETFGIIRVPMFTMRDGYRGFPSFLSNSFAGNAKNQLLNFLKHSNLMTLPEINMALENSLKGFPK